MKDLVIRPARPDDRDSIQRIVEAAGNFNEEEIATAIEVLEESIARGEASGYLTVVAEDTGPSHTLLGYASYGPTPMTQGVFDLYWIAVDRDARGRGVGRVLLSHVEHDATSRNGRLIVLDTSSREGYEATIRFYERAGYELVSRIRDFYRIGDDKLEFVKRLQ